MWRHTQPMGGRGVGGGSGCTRKMPFLGPYLALPGPLGHTAGHISSISTQQTQRHLQNCVPDRFRRPGTTPLSAPGGVYFSEPKGFVKVYATGAQSTLLKMVLQENFSCVVVQFQETLPRDAPHAHRLSRCSASPAHEAPRLLSATKASLAGFIKSPAGVKYVFLSLMAGLLSVSERGPREQPKRCGSQYKLM